MSMTESELRTLRRAVAVYGPRRQAIKALEELGELTQALCKWLGGDDPDTERALWHVSEEIADVEIMLAQLRIMMGSDNDVNAWTMLKISRLKDRLDAAEAMPP